MRKCSRLSGLFLCILTLCVCSCANSGSSTADPMGTGTVTLTADATQVQPGGSCTLTATVTNQTGEGTTVPVIGERVSFALLTANGGTLAAASDRTGSGGVATAIYTAGNNMASDTVRVTTDVGATAAITITKTGGIVGARISSLAASSTSVAAGQTTVVTAKVTDGNSNPMQGETVTFTLPVNESGARFVSASGAGVASIPVTTDASGNAVAVYFAGSTSPSVDVYDTIRATLANGSSNSVVITRSAGTAPTAYNIAVDASPTALTATTSNSVVTATVTSGTTAISGVTVTFTVTHGGGAGSVSPPGTAITDGSGNASIIFTGAGGGTDDTDTVTASITVDGNTYSASVVITYP